MNVAERTIIEQELQTGLDIPDDLKSTIEKVALGQLTPSKETGFEMFQNRIFKLIKYPGLIIKMKPNMEGRYEHILQAKSVCKTHRLEHLIIPKVKKFVFENTVVLVEEFIDFNPSDSGQMELYRQHAANFCKTAHELAVFVAETGFFDVTPRNIPIINEAADFQGDRRVALIDLEHMDPDPQSKEAGFNGGKTDACGLIHCLFSEAQIDSAISVASKYGIKLDHEKKYRVAEIESYEGTLAHYERKGITGKEPIQVDLDGLDLELEKEGTCAEYGLQNFPKKTQMRNAAKKVVEEINRLLGQKHDLESLIGKRSILLKTSEYPMNVYQISPFSPQEIRDKKVEEYWVYQILAALVVKGHVYRKVGESAHGILLQV